MSQVERSRLILCNISRKRERIENGFKTYFSPERGSHRHGRAVDPNPRRGSLQASDPEMGRHAWNWREYFQILDGKYSYCEIFVLFSTR